MTTVYVIEINLQYIFIHIYIDNFDSLLYKRPTTTFVSNIWDAGYMIFSHKETA